MPVGLSPTMEDIPDNLYQRQKKSNKEELKTINILEMMSRPKVEHLE